MAECSLRRWGQPITAHWGVEDPAAFAGSDDKQRLFFSRIFSELDARIRIFVSLRLEDLDALALQRRLDEIGRAGKEVERAAL